MDRRALADIAGSVGKVAVTIARERALPVRLGADPGIVPPSTTRRSTRWAETV
jgi:hypothetical protein